MVSDYVIILILVAYDHNFVTSIIDTTSSYKTFYEFIKKLPKGPELSSNLLVTPIYFGSLLPREKTLI